MDAKRLSFIKMFGIEKTFEYFRLAHYKACSLFVSSFRLERQAEQKYIKLFNEKK